MFVIKLKQEKNEAKMNNKKVCRMVIIIQLQGEAETKKKRLNLSLQKY